MTASLSLIPLVVSAGLDQSYRHLSLLRMSLRGVGGAPSAKEVRATVGLRTRQHVRTRLCRMRNLKTPLLNMDFSNKFENILKQIFYKSFYLRVAHKNQMSVWRDVKAPSQVVKELENSVVPMCRLPQSHPED